MCHEGTLVSIPGTRPQPKQNLNKTRRNKLIRLRVYVYIYIYTEPVHYKPGEPYQEYKNHMPMQTCDFLSENATATSQAFEQSSAHRKIKEDTLARAPARWPLPKVTDTDKYP